MLRLRVPERRDGLKPGRDSVFSARAPTSPLRDSENFGCRIRPGLIQLPKFFYAPLLHVVTARLACRALEPIFVAPRGRSMQDPGCELLRIPLPRTPLDKAPSGPPERPPNDLLDGPRDSGDPRAGTQGISQAISSVRR